MPIYAHDIHVAYNMLWLSVVINYIVVLGQGQGVPPRTAQESTSDEDSQTDEVPTNYPDSRELTTEAYDP